jgi:hypothetical protein
MKTMAFLALIAFAVSSAAAPEPEETSPLQMPDFSAMVKELADDDIGLMARIHFATRGLPGTRDQDAPGLGFTIN